jgi:predicted CoA-binding protein
VRPDLQQVDGLKSYAQLADIPVRLDPTVIFRRADAAPQFVAEAASKRVEAVWLPPGVWTRQAEEQAHEHHVLLIKDRCIEEETSPYFERQQASWATGSTLKPPPRV